MSAQTRYYHRHKNDPGFREKRAAYEARPEVRALRNERAKLRARRARAEGRQVTLYNRDETLRRKYGITEADYQAMYAEQAGRCYICSTFAERLDVDHNHETRAVRALLCNLCNQGLGVFRDDPVRLMAGAAYLTAFAANP